MLYQQGSNAGSKIQSYVFSQGYNSGYTWTYSDIDAPVDDDDDDGVNMYLIVIIGLVGVFVVGGIVLMAMKYIRGRPEVDDDPMSGKLESLLDGSDLDSSFTISA